MESVSQRLNVTEVVKSVKQSAILRQAVFANLSAWIVKIIHHQEKRGARKPMLLVSVKKVFGSKISIVNNLAPTLVNIMMEKSVALLKFLNIYLKISVNM